MIKREEIVPEKIIKETKKIYYVCECCEEKFYAPILCKEHEKDCFLRKEFMKTKPKFEKGDVVNFMYHDVLTFATVTDVYCADYKESFCWYVKVDEPDSDEDGFERFIEKEEDYFGLVMTYADYEAKVREIESNFKGKTFFGTKFKNCVLDHGTGIIMIAIEHLK